MSNISKGDILSPEEISIIENLVDLPISGEGEFMRKISSDDFLSALPEAQSPTGNYLSSVSTDATLTGIGTVGDPLSVVDEGIYALLLGRAGGQTLIGGTASGEDLTLQSTSDATKGKILFGTSAYDEVNNRLGIGTMSPGYLLDVVKSQNAYTLMGVKNTTNGTSALAGIFVGNGTKSLSISYRSAAYTDNATLADAGVIRTDSTVTGGMKFLTGGDYPITFSTNGTEIMRIGEDGNVGIGTATPGAKLDIASGSIRLDDGQGIELNNTSQNGLFIEALASPFGTILRSQGRQFFIIDSNNNDADTEYFAFKKNNADPNSATEIMRIGENGNVGIGTTTPNQKLTIEGTQSLKEQSNANADTVGYGQIWIKNETPNELWFTDDGGNDVRVGAVGTDARTITLVLADGTTDLAVEDGIGSFTWTVPIEFNGWDLILAHASVETAGVTGVSTFQIHNVTQTADMLSTKITIDTTETTSYTAATPPVIDAANDDIATGDKIRFDVDGISTTAPKGLQVILTIKKP